MTQKTQFEYIRFEQSVQPRTSTTPSWRCRSKGGGDLLGLVLWHHAQYCFFPEKDTAFNAGCLNDIRTFLKELNVAHYAPAKGDDPNNRKQAGDRTAVAMPSPCPKRR